MTDVQGMGEGGRKWKGYGGINIMGKYNKNKKVNAVWEKYMLPKLLK